MFNNFNQYSQPMQGNFSGHSCDRYGEHACGDLYRR